MHGLGVTPEWIGKQLERRELGGKLDRAIREEDFRGAGLGSKDLRFGKNSAAKLTQKGKPKIVRALAKKEGIDFTGKGGSEYLKHASAFAAGVVRGGQRGNSTPFEWNSIRVNAFAKGDALVLARANGGEFLTILDRSQHMSSHLLRNLDLLR